MKKIINNGLTLVEVMIVMGVLAILAVSVFFVLNPKKIIEQTRTDRAVTELSEIGKALELWNLKEGALPPEVDRNLPPGIEKYLNTNDRWPNGPFEGSVYDYDNWTDETCIDPEASGTVQITLRQIPGKNPDGTNVWAMYYVIKGKGTPDCLNNNEWNKGECVNCSE